MCRNRTNECDKSERAYNYKLCMIDQMSIRFTNEWLKRKMNHYHNLYRRFSIKIQATIRKLKFIYTIFNQCFSYWMIHTKKMKNMKNEANEVSSRFFYTCKCFIFIPALSIRACSNYCKNWNISHTFYSNKINTRIIIGFIIEKKNYMNHMRSAPNYYFLACEILDAKNEINCGT